MTMRCASRAMRVTRHESVEVVEVVGLVERRRTSSNLVERRRTSSNVVAARTDAATDVEEVRPTRFGGWLYA